MTQYSVPDITDITTEQFDRTMKTNIVSLSVHHFASASETDLYSTARSS